MNRDLARIDGSKMSDERSTNGPDIAIVGMAGRFPGADDPEALWRLLEEGEEALRALDPAESIAAGVDPALLGHPDYVGRKGMLGEVAEFDAAFFGINPRDARLMDPQQRLFLESCHRALENAGLDAKSRPGLVGVFAGTNLSTYQMHNLMSNPRAAAGASVLQVQIGNDKDYLATSVAYKLELEGPAVTVQTACSTSLAAVHLAIQSLLDESCDVAVAGGVSIVLPAPLGYLYQRDGILSPDGRCRPFDADAAGTVFSDGVAVVVLKRLAAAVADGDTVLAVIRGSAMNNDGAAKVGFTAPSVDGQARVVAEALGVAGVEPDDVSYVECHGTGTKMGDPIEVTALDRAFRGRGRDVDPCWIGSAKGNLGHLRMASGVTGLIKVVQMLRHQRLVASLHYRRANPDLRLEERPFRVVDRALPWHCDGRRIAGVSSFGMGGTNVHLVVEEAPRLPAGEPDRPWQVLPLSARTPAALEAVTRQMAEHLTAFPPQGEGELTLADIAHTLQVGRRAHPERRAVLARDASDAALALRDPARQLDRSADAEDRPVVFLLPGQGTQRAGVGSDLYRHEEVFRREVDRCCELLEPHLGFDLRSLLYPAAGQAEEADERLRQTALTQPAVFVTGWAQAQLWRSWGIEPESLLGHSLGEYVAATIAEVFDLESALALVTERGRLLQSLPPGVMTAVPLPVEEVEGLLPDHPEVSIAAINGDQATVVSGPEPPVAALEEVVRARRPGIALRRLRTSHAFHSRMVEPILDAFRERVAACGPGTPRRPFVSNLTGTWIGAQEARDPGYWVDHLRRPVRFAAGLKLLLTEPSRVFLEVGAGRTLSGLARRLAPSGAALVASLGERRDDGEDGHEVVQVQGALARLWLSGVTVDWARVRGGRRRRRLPLPTYPFERKTFWVHPGRALGVAGWVDAETLAHVTDPAPDPLPAESETAPAGPARHSPRDPLERSVADVWCAALGLDTVGVHEDFFELGGHSLLAAELTARLQAVLGREVSVRQLYDAPTVSGLSAALRHGEEPARPASLGVPPAVERGADGQLPASPAQERMAFLDRLEPGNPVFNLFVPLKLRGEVDADSLERALGALVDRHEALRTVFRYENDELLACASGERPKLTVAPAGRPLAELIAVERAHSFDLARGPLLRLTLSPLEDSDDHALLVNVHHVVADHLSVNVLVRDLSLLYAHATGTEAAERAALPPLPLQYADFAAHELRQVAAGALEPQIDYWRRRLVGLRPCLDLASDRPRPPERSFRGGHVPLDIDAAAAAELRALARRERVSSFMALLAVLDVVLHCWSLSEDIVVGAPFARRELPASREVVGPFFNPVVLRTDLSGDPTFRQLLSRIRATVTEAHAHQDVPFERLVEILAPERDPSFNPLFQVMFSFQEGGVDEAAAAGGLRVEPLDLRALGLSGGHTHFDLFLVMQEHPAPASSFRGSLGYATDLFDATSAEELVEHFRTVLAAAVAEPDLPLSRLRVRVPAQKLRVAVNASFTAEPLAEPLEWALRRLGVPSLVETAPYGQLFQQLLDPDSPVCRNVDGYSVFLLRLEDWGRGAEPRKARRRIEQEAERFFATLAALRHRLPVRALVAVLPMSERSAADPAMARFLRAQARWLAQRLAAVPDVLMADGERLAKEWRVEQVHDAHADALGHIPYTESYFAALAAGLAHALAGATAAALVPGGPEGATRSLSADTLPEATGPRTEAVIA